MKSKYAKYLIGFLLLALILFTFNYSSFSVFLLSVFFIIITMKEYRKMFKQIDVTPHPILPELVSIICAFIFAVTNDYKLHSMITPILIFGVITSFVLTVLRNKKPYLMTSFSTIIAFLLTFCGLYIIKLTYYFEAQNAWYLILVYFLAVLSGDFFASILGPKFGKAKLSSEISPNKTILGSIVHVICAILSCLLLVKFLNFPVLYTIILGIVISAFAQLGDLTISTFKRELGLKHSGNFFVEYGGFLDRMDAFIFSAPAAFYFLFLTQIM